MDDSLNSGDDLFITQSPFRCDADTQEAEEAANFFLDDGYDPTKPEVVKYLDFSNQDNAGHTIMTESQLQEAKTNNASDTVSLEDDGCTESKVCGVLFFFFHFMFLDKQLARTLFCKSCFS